MYVPPQTLRAAEKFVASVMAAKRMGSPTGRRALVQGDAAPYGERLRIELQMSCRSCLARTEVLPADEECQERCGRRERVASDFCCLSGSYASLVAPSTSSTELD